MDTSIKEFLESFSSFEYLLDTSLNLQSYLSQLNTSDDIDTDVNTIHYIVFIAGYTVHKYLLKSQNCSECRIFLTEEKDLQVEEHPDSKYKLVQIIDRGSLRWPSNNVIDSILTVWSTVRKIENSSELWKDFFIGIPMLIKLTVILVELQQSETWRYTCPGCGVI